MNLTAKSKSTSYFSLSKPLLLLLVLSFGYFLFFRDSSLIEVGGSGLFNFTKGWPLLLRKIASLILFLASIFLINRIAVKHKLPEDVTEVVWIYPLFAAISLPELFRWTEYFTSILFVVLAMSTLLNIHKQTNILKEVFVASVFSGIAALFCFSSIVFLILSFLAIALFRPFELRSYFMAMIGGALPFFYFFGVAFVLGYGAFALNMDFTFPWQSVQLQDWQELAIGGSLLLIGLISVFYTLGIQSKLVVRKRNQLNLLVAFLSLSVLLTVFYFQNGTGFIFLAIAGSLFFSWFYQGLRRKWILDICLFLVLGMKWWIVLVDKLL